MSSASDMQGVAVFAPRGGRGSAFLRLGRVRMVIFSPNGRQALGYLVRRPDVAGMVRRPDVFVTLDSVVACDGGVRVTRPDGTGDAARVRLGIDDETWDRCVAWVGMDVITCGGRELGYVSDVTFDGRTGMVDHFLVGDGNVAHRLVGSVEVPVTLLRGCRDGSMVVADDAASLAPAGGLAGRAGEAVGRVRMAGTTVATKAGTAADQAIDQGSRALGRQLAKTKGMFGSFLSEYRRASGSEDVWE